MKIIIKGTMPEEVPWWIGKRFSCKKCGCVFELEKGDIDNNNILEFKYTCPTCKNMLLLRKPATLPASNSIFSDVFDSKIFDEMFGNLRHKSK